LVVTAIANVFAEKWSKSPKIMLKTITLGHRLIEKELLTFSYSLSLTYVLPKGN
jgi:hypothetical protein